MLIINTKAIIALLVVLILSFSCFAADFQLFTKNKVIELRDTNRFRIDTHGTIKLIGVMTPSLNDLEINKKIARAVNKSVELINRQSLSVKYIVSMLMGLQVDAPAMTHILTLYDPVFRSSENLDEYGNLMVYVVLPSQQFSMIKYADYTPVTMSLPGSKLEMMTGKNGSMLNASLISSGLGIVDETYNFSEKEKFLELQNQAQRQKRGLWS